MITSDVLILGLQLVILAVTVQKKNLAKPSRTSSGSAIAGGVPSQDHNSEEQGIRRSEEGAEGIEMEDLPQRFEGRTEGGEEGHRNELMEHRGWQAMGHASNAYTSGQHTVIIVHILDTIRGQWKATYTESDGTSADSSAGVAATMARRRPRFTLSFGERA
ncbi:MAG: hypothetical protein Q9221_005575 [Calogaya cf. arnoldii]